MSENSSRNAAGSLDKKQVVSWAMYDWANHAFATTVMAGFFPVFFKEYWSAGTSVAISTFHLGAANSAASMAVAILAPILGAIADKGNARKKFLFSFAALGMLMTWGLYYIAKGDWRSAVVFYALASVGYAAANIFYDSLLLDVAAEGKRDFISALGFSFGYLGGGILFAVNVLMTFMPQKFGLADAGAAVRTSFATAALWWAFFSIPIFLFVKEKRTGEAAARMEMVKAGFRQLSTTFRKVRDLRVVFTFLVAYWLYIDGVGTIIRMAVDYGMSLGFSSKSLVLALLMTQFVAFPSAVIFGKIGEKLGPKPGIYLGIAVYLFVTVWGYYMHREAEFFVMAGLIGTVQGGVQSLSRSLYSRIIPESQAGEFFGFYNLLGKFAAVIGPFLMGWVSIVTGDVRDSIFAISFLFICGAAVLTAVDVKKGERLAKEFKEA